jgi:hypothetical protein
MKTRIFFSISFAILFSFLFTVKTYSQANRPDVKENFTSQETREMDKMKSSGIKLRSMYAKLVLSGEKPPVLVEELFLNKKGLMVEKKRYNNHELDARFLFKYNSKDKLVEKTTFSGKDVLVEREISKLNKAGNPTEVTVEIRSRKGLEKKRKLVKYDKEGLMVEVNVYDMKTNKHELKEKYEYKDGLMISTKAYNPDGVLYGSEEYEYDARKNKIKEIVTSHNPPAKKDTSTAVQDSKARETKSEFILKYDDKGSIAEISAPLYRQVFTINEKGDFTRDIIYDKRGNNKQNDNEFIYNENGLLKQVTRYYPDGKPGAYITYAYEFYDKTRTNK